MWHYLSVPFHASQAIFEISGDALDKQNKMQSEGNRNYDAQKYEKGVNRIGASRLFQLSQVLDVPIQFFFQDAPAEGGVASPALRGSEQDAVIYDFLNSREGLELNRAFVRISDARVRRSIVELMRSLSGASTNDTAV